MNIIKKILRWIFPEAYSLLRKKWRGRNLKAGKIIKAFSECYPEAVFVQIGSNDGLKHDPISRAITTCSWTGVLVEPVPYVFERLKKHRHKLERVQLENVAIAEVEGQLPFYYLRQESDATDLPAWYDELGSFRKDVLIKHVDRIPDIESRVECIQVECIKFSTLCIRNNIKNVDLIHIDTEGYDYEIIKSINFETHRPKLLIYEHKHLSEMDVLQCRDALEKYGYQLFSEAQDTWCVDTKEFSSAQLNFLRGWKDLTSDTKTAYA